MQQFLFKSCRSLLKLPFNIDLALFTVRTVRTVRNSPQPLS